MTAKTLECDAAEGSWQAVYVFYAGPPRPLLLRCFEPLVAELRSRDLISGYFFVNYWLQGHHVRLRLKVASGAAVPELRERAETAITAFIAAKPSLFGERSQIAINRYREMLEREFSAAERAQYLDADGRPRLRPNNSFSWERYEPEYGKYGGPVGVELAEWHFSHSSDLVLAAARQVNLHLHTVLLGFSAQLMMVMAAAFLPDNADQAECLTRNHEFWDRVSSPNEDQGAPDRYAYPQERAARVGRRFAEIRAAIAAQELDRLPEFERRWAVHCAELRRRVVRAAEAGDLVFSGPGGQDEVVTDPVTALTRLMSAYAHMTNNRLGVSVPREAYLYHLLGRALNEATVAGGR
jgi:Lantibiotic biosynthesis dehydratase C-term